MVFKIMNLKKGVGIDHLNKKVNCNSIYEIGS